LIYRRTITFWLLLIVGWLIAALFFSLLARLLASFDDLTPTESWITGIAIHVLAALAGFAFVRSRTRRSSAPGFPVVTKSEGGPDAG
jgi:ABC-type uncharacterized transport system permease subunit